MDDVVAVRQGRVGRRAQGAVGVRDDADAHGASCFCPGDPIPDVIVHGHTHVPELIVGPEARPAAIYMCPGAVFRPRSDFGRTIFYR